MNTILSASPVLETFTESDLASPELLMGCEHAVSLEHMSWLLKQLVYFVENPAKTKSAAEAQRFYTHVTDKKYLLRVFRIADYLCMSEEVLNSIALAVLECFFFSADWSPALLDYYPLEKRIKSLWATFVDDMAMCLRHQNAFTDEVDYWSEEMHVYHGCNIQLDLGDFQDVFGRQGRALVACMRAQEKHQDYNLSHYVFEHEHTYKMKNVFRKLITMCIKSQPHWWCTSMTSPSLSWLRKHLEDLRKEHLEREEAVAMAAAIKHNAATCDCETCMKTHHSVCGCRIHRDAEPEFEYDDYVEPDWETQAELNWERRYGGW
jgi:hypothetical protein